MPKKKKTAKKPTKRRKRRVSRRVRPMGVCMGDMGVQVEPIAPGKCPPGYVYVPATEVEQAEVYEVKGRRLPRPIIRPAHRRAAYCRRPPGAVKYGLLGGDSMALGYCEGPMGVVVKPVGGRCPPGYTYVPATEVKRAEITTVKGRRLPGAIIRPAHRRAEYCRRLPGYAKFKLTPERKPAKKRRRRKKKAAVAGVDALALEGEFGIAPPCPPGWIEVPETVVTHYGGVKLPEPIVRPAYCRRPPGAAKYGIMGVGQYELVPEMMGQIVGTPVIGAAKWIFSMEGIKNIGAGVAGVLGGALMTKYIVPQITKAVPQLEKVSGVLSGLGGAIIGYEVGARIFKDVRLGEVAAVAALAGSIFPLIAKPLGLAGLGQVRVPEEVEIADISDLGQVRIPEEVEIAGSIGQEEVITEEELLGETEGSSEGLF